MESLGLISLAEEISRQINIDCIVWLLVITLRQICNEKEQVGQQNIYCVRRKGILGNLMLEARFILKKIRSIPV